MIEISNKNKALYGTVALASSKSISNRLLIIQHLCKSKFEIQNLKAVTYFVEETPILFFKRKYNLTNFSKVQARSSRSPIVTFLKKIVTSVFES